MCLCDAFVDPLWVVGLFAEKHFVLLSCSVWDWSDWFMFAVDEGSNKELGSSVDDIIWIVDSCWVTNDNGLNSLEEGCNCVDDEKGWLKDDWDWTKVDCSWSDKEGLGWWENVWNCFSGKDECECDFAKCVCRLFCNEKCSE